VTGDVVLVVGPEQLKLRVHSLILKATSKPFAAMLGPNWTKGHDKPDRDMPMEVLLPEDNAISLKYICAIAHYQNQMIPDDLTAQDVLGIAIMADKYDIVDALSLASRPWLLTSKKNSSRTYGSHSCGIFISEPKGF
jgi:hypothetical protein